MGFWVRTELRIWWGLFIVISCVLVHWYYKESFIYPQKLYEQTHNLYVDLCIEKQGVSKEACLEFNSLYDVRDFKKLFRQKMEGYDGHFHDIPLNSIAPNYLEFIKLEKYQTEICLVSPPKGAPDDEKVLAEYCDCRMNELKKISLASKPIKKPTKAEALEVVQKANKKAGDICKAL